MFIYLNTLKSETSFASTVKSIRDVNQLPFQNKPNVIFSNPTGIVTRWISGHYFIGLSVHILAPPGGKKSHKVF